MATNTPNSLSNKPADLLISSNDSSVPSLLGVPAEVRWRIYAHLFDGIVLVPSTRNPTAAPPGTLSPASGLSILYVCRKIHAEAHFTLLRVATFRLNNKKQHVLFTQVDMLPHLNRIRRLSIDSSLMLEWSPTLLRLTMHSLSHFEVRDIRAAVGHQDMLKVEDIIYRSSSGSKSSMRPLRWPSMDVFQLAVAHIDGDCNLILAHFNEVTVRDTLVLHFQVHCLHVGQLVVPGQFPMANAAHEHPPKDLVYAFSRKQMLAAKPGSDSANGWS